ncbi:hypothetical protein [Aliivibrio sp. EL58]|uniref:hypothetical protein n=1 Tax=Aliivibrio sp. EL58 TaxID=2107582 RepID=UPI000EFD8D52|nr:hypothetical protein [Aliivibrio sp. EL58]
MINWKALIFLPILFMYGCADQVSERHGTDIDVFPVTFSIQLVKSKKAEVKLSAFIDIHESEMKNHGVDIQWFNNKGKKWANELNKKLISSGIDKKVIVIHQGKKATSHFDMKVSLITPKVVVSHCEYATHYNIGTKADGCFTENARWSSMVNPQKMLLDTTNLVPKAGE